jgi:hypothetical protein
MLIERFIPSLRFRRRRGSEASVSSVSRLEQVIDGSDIDPAKLARTVKAKFRQGEYTVTVSTVPASENMALMAYGWHLLSSNLVETRPVHSRHPKTIIVRKYNL